GQGLLRLVRSLEVASRVGDADLEEAAPLNLAAWRTHFVGQRFVAKHREGIWPAAFSADETTVLTASYDSTVRRWDAATGAERGRARDHPQHVGGAVFGRDGPVLPGSGPNGPGPGGARLGRPGTDKPPVVLAYPSCVGQVAFRPGRPDILLTVCYR